ncbi:unnamed protein product [Allacma fusca]|uniref:Uncharacterized protein n=1 Tax=Allacma fusca TaxID=39272 RepID=A0A8J2PQ93_9HEXA|nr:unnamed protein product [Allacma fusca]
MPYHKNKTKQNASKGLSTKCLREHRCCTRQRTSQVNWSGGDEALAGLTPDKIRDFVDQCLEDNAGYEDRSGWSIDQFQRFWQLQNEQKLHKVEVAANVGGDKAAKKTFRERTRRFRKGIDMRNFEALPPGYVVVFNMLFQKLLKEEKAYLMAQLAYWDRALNPKFWKHRVSFCFGAPKMAEQGQFQVPNKLVPGPNEEPVAGPSRRWIPIQPPNPPKKIQIRFTQPTKKFYVGYMPQREVAALPGRQVTEAPLTTPGE